MFTTVTNNYQSEVVRSVEERTEPLQYVSAMVNPEKYGTPGEKYPIFTVNTLKANGASLRTGLYWFTPSVCEEILRFHNLDNRTIKQNRLSDYTKEMAAGYWEANGEGMQFSDKLNCLNGQHRLLSAIKSGRSFLATVTFGCPESSATSIDKGAAKSPGDDLNRWGVKKHKVVIGAALRKMWYYQYLQGKRDRNYPSRKEFEMLFLEHITSFEKDAVPLWQESGMQGSPLLTGGLSLTATYLLLKTGKNEEVTEFLTQFGKGVRLEDGMPVLALRKKLEKGSSRGKEAKDLLGARGNMVEAKTLALIFKVWEAFLAGKQVTRLSLPDNFPDPD